MPIRHSNLKNGFELGPYSILPNRGLVQSDGKETHVEPLVMDVLLALASHHGDVVSKDELVEQVWRGRATTDEVIAAKISLLRKALGDDTKNPVFVETVQKRGYRLKASVDVRQAGTGAAPGSIGHLGLILVGVAVLIAGFAVYKLLPSDKRIESVAILQFRNLSEDVQKFQYVVDGFAEELVVTLDQVPGIQLTRGGESRENQSLQQIADQLNVDAVITGSLRTDGDNLRVTTQLMLANGFQVWGDRFDGILGDVFSIQEDVALNVQHTIAGNNRESFRSISRPANSEAYDAYMRGLFFLARRDPDSLQRALELFAETVELDPGFGPAYLRQAITLLLTARYSPGNERAIFDAALDIAARGGQADAGIREPIQLIHGFVNHELRNWAEAANAYDRAMRAHTVYPTAMNWYSLFLGDLGFADLALERSIAARQLEPAAPTLNSRVAITHLWQDDLESASEFFDAANLMKVGVPDHYFVYVIYLLRNNQLDAAQLAMTTALQLAQQSSDWVEPLFASLADPDNPQLKQTALQIIDIAAANDDVPVYVPLVLWSFFGESSRMMDLAHERADSGAPFKNLELIYQDEFAAFRQEPGFPSLLEKLGLARYWSSIGCEWQDDHPIQESADRTGCQIEH